MGQTWHGSHSLGILRQLFIGTFRLAKVAGVIGRLTPSVMHSVMHFDNDAVEHI